MPCEHNNIALYEDQPPVREDSPPQTWVVEGWCEDCLDEIEVQYTYDKILD